MTRVMAASQGSWHVSETLLAALVSMDAALLAALIVVASLLSLRESRTVDGQFSLAASRSWARSTSVLRFAYALVWLASLGALLSIVAAVLPWQSLRWTAVAVSCAVLVLFAAMTTLALRWLVSDATE